MKSYNIVYEVECVSVQWVGTCWLMGGCALYHCSRSGVDKCVCGGHKSLIPSASVSYVLQYIKKHLNSLSSFIPLPLWITLVVFSLPLELRKTEILCSKIGHRNTKIQKENIEHNK